MSRDLKISIGHFSDKGRKAANQDFHGALIPGQPLLGLKGIAVALADGIGSSAVSGIASESAVKGFLTDYYCTSEAWSVKTSAQRVITAMNSWLHSQTRRSQHAYDKDKGYVCTFSALVLKSRTLHLFHIGDCRIYRIAGRSLEQLTIDHRVAVSSDQTYLSRALGMDSQVEIDYQALQLVRGDVFLMATDGVHEHVGAQACIEAIDARAGDLDAAARAIAGLAHDHGSPDNLTVQILRIDALPDGEASELLDRSADLPVPPLLEAGTEFDGYRIVREIHASSRSHIYQAVDPVTGNSVAIKIPSIDLQGDAAYLRRFMMEEWVGRRIDSPHVLRPCAQSRTRKYLYVATEFIEGRTLAQWMHDNPRPELEVVRGIVEQIAKGLHAMHRKEMLHQDLRPENIMIDRFGTARIIDFGSAHVAGIAEAMPAVDARQVLGTAQYTAPECFLGLGGTARSDMFSLGVITYQMLTGRLPYGAAMSRARNRSQQRKIAYASSLEWNQDLPAWIDGVLGKAVHPDPGYRYEELSEYTHDLRHGRGHASNDAFVPLIARNPVAFWKATSLLLALLLLWAVFVLVSRQN